MPRKAKTARDEITDEQAKATGGKRSKKAAPIGETLEEMKADGVLKPAAKAYTQLEPATLESIEAAKAESRHPDPESLPEKPAGPPEERNGKPHDDEQTRWRDLVDRPKFAPVPEGFFGVSSIRTQDAGIRVNKNTLMEGGQKVSVAALQFAETHLPNRAEKDLLEQIHEPDDGLADKRRFHYRPERRQWERKGSPDEPLGENVIDAQRIAESLATARRESRERMEEVMGRA